MHLTIESKVIQEVFKKLERLEAYIKNNAQLETKWISEEQTMLLTGLSKRSLQRKRKDNILEWSTESGRKIKYLRRSVERFMDNNSTITKN